MSLCAYSVSGLINNGELALELERIFLPSEAEFFERPI